MNVFSFDVTLSTHGLLKLGVTEATYNSTNLHHRIVVADINRDDAALTAAQMVSCIPGVMCTGVYDRI